MKKSKVFVGVANIAGTAMHVANALRMAGYEASSYADSSHAYGYGSDREYYSFKISPKMKLKKLFRLFLIEPLNAILYSFYFISALLRYDTFIFISVYTFFKNHIDLPILKFFGKKVSFIFVGCPEMDPNDPINNDGEIECAICKDEDLQKYCLCDQPQKKGALVRKTESYADTIFSIKVSDGFLNHPEKTLPFYVISKPAPGDGMLDKYKNTEKIKIAHFPSNTLLKGTKTVLEAIEKIKDKYGDRVEFIMERMPNSELLKKLEEIHILIDQFHAIHGLLSVEAMSRGCVVIARLGKWFVEERPEIPIVNSSQDELEKNLIKLIDERIHLKSIGEKSIEYYNKYHHPKAVGKYLGETLNLVGE